MLDQDYQGDFKFRYETLSALNRIVRLLKDSFFILMWPYIYKTTFDFVSSNSAKEFIQNAGQAFDESSSNDSVGSQSDVSKNGAEEDKADENIGYQELTVQTSFDLFSYLSQRASCDSDAIGGSSKDFVQQVMESVATN